MNERIKEFFDQAIFDESRIIDGIYYPYIALQSSNSPTRFSITKEQYEKFAELIVKECAQVVFSKTGPKSALNILEHFGIEE